MRTASTEPNTFPYDLLLEVGGREEARSLALFAFFPRLAYPLLRELAQHDRAALSRLYTAYRAHLPSQRLGKQQTQRYLLEFVYGVIPEAIGDPVELVRYLLRRYRLGQTPSPSLDALLLEHWQARPTLAALPLAALLRDSGALYQLLAAAWPAYLAEQGFPVAAESNTLALTLFDDRDIQAYMDTLFLEAGYPNAVARADSGLRLGRAASSSTRYYDRERFTRYRRTRRALPYPRVLSRVANFAPRWPRCCVCQTRRPQRKTRQRAHPLHEAVERAPQSAIGPLRPLDAAPIPTPALGPPVAECWRIKYGPRGKGGFVGAGRLAWDQWLVLPIRWPSNRKPKIVSSPGCQRSRPSLARHCWPVCRLMLSLTPGSAPTPKRGTGRAFGPDRGCRLQQCSTSAIPCRRHGKLRYTIHVSGCWRWS